MGILKIYSKEIGEKKINVYNYDSLYIWKLTTIYNTYNKQNPPKLDA